MRESAKGTSPRSERPPVSVVTVQDDREHVSSVVLGEDEAFEHLALEADIHAAAGWVVKRMDNIVVARRDGITRRIYIRAFDAMEDK